MNVQEREERDFHPQSDERNAFDCSRMELSVRNSEQQGKIDALLAFGKFLVVANCPAYCHSTDAVIGDALCILRICNSRFDAQRAISRIEHEDFTDLKLLPAGPPAKVPAWLAKQAPCK